MDMFKSSSRDFINHCIRRERLNAIDHESGIRNGVKEDGNNGKKTNRAVTKSKACFSIITGMENQNKGKEYHEENIYRSRNSDSERNATRYYDSNNEETSATIWYQYNDTSTVYHNSPPPLIDEDQVSSIGHMKFSLDTDSDINTQQWDNSIRDEANSVYTRELDGISITSLEDYHRLYSSDQGNNDLESSNDSTSWSEDDTQTDSSEYQSDTMMMDDDGDTISLQSNISDYTG
jgi:hypothetical protein